MNATTPATPLRHASSAALIVLAAQLSACIQTTSAEPDAASTSPGPADDFSWYWDTVSAMPDQRDSYSIEVRFTNMSDAASAIPDCWSVGGPGHAGSMTWEHRPVVRPGDSMWVSGIATFAGPIWEIDEIVCDLEVAASYRG